MTLPPGLQAVRERAASAMRHHPDFGSTPIPRLLDLIETLAGALEGIGQHSGEDDDGVLDEWTEAAAFDECKDIARAALDKYREFK